MGTHCAIILDLKNDLSIMENISEKLPEQIGYAIGIQVYKRVIQFGLKTIGIYCFLRSYSFTC
jgi:translation elongation factor EF-1beta